MEHYVPLHPQVVVAIQPLRDGREDDNLCSGTAPSGCGSRGSKSLYCTSKGISCSVTFASFASSMAAIGRDKSNRAYIMTHGVSGIDWKHYKHPHPESVYDVYMEIQGLSVI